MAGPDHTQRAHSSWGASSAKQWMNCEGSIAAQAPFPNTSGPDADLGTAAHELAEAALLSGKCPTAYIGEIFVVNNVEYVVDDEMARNVRVYVDMIREDQAKYGGELVVEARFDLSKHVHPGMFGTNDAMLINCTDRILRVYDYKNGEGVYVEVIENPQLKYYGLGAIFDLDLRGVEAVEIVVVQPRHRQWEHDDCRFRIDVIDLFDFGVELAEAVERTKAPDAPRHAGDWCTFCRAKGVCPEFRNSAVAAAQAEFADDGSLEVEPPHPLELSPEVAGEMLKVVPQLKAWCAAIEKHCKDIMDKGGTVPGWKLVLGQNRRYFDDFKAVQDTLTIDLGFKDADLFSAPKPKSVNEIEKLVGRATYREHIKPYVETRRTAPVMALVSDKRPAIEGSAVTDFDGDDGFD